MIYLKKISVIMLLGVIVISTLQCSTAQKLQTAQPFIIGEVYYQDWVSGVIGGGSGTNIYIQMVSNPKQIELDSVYFHGKSAKLEYFDNTFLIGNFNSNTNSKKDMVMSNEPYAEYGNKIPELTKKIPFHLNDNQCIISYIEGHKIKYFKIDNIIEKELLAYPSAPNNKE
jgi:hypothetical protein